MHRHGDAMHRSRQWGLGRVQPHEHQISRPQVHRASGPSQDSQAVTSPSWVRQIGVGTLRPGCGVLRQIQPCFASIDGFSHDVGPPRTADHWPRIRPGKAQRISQGTHKSQERSTRPSQDNSSHSCCASYCSSAANLSPDCSRDRPRLPCSSAVCGCSGP